MSSNRIPTSPDPTPAPMPYSTGLEWPSLDQALTEEAARARHDGMKAMNGYLEPVAPMAPAERPAHIELLTERCLELLSALGTLVGEPTTHTLRARISELATFATDTAEALQYSVANQRQADDRRRQAHRETDRARAAAVALEQDHADARLYALHYAGLDIDDVARRFDLPVGVDGAPWSLVRAAMLDDAAAGPVAPQVPLADTPAPRRFEQIVADSPCTDVLTDVLVADESGPTPSRFFVCTVKGPHTEHSDGSGTHWTRTRTIDATGNDQQGVSVTAGVSGIVPGGGGGIVVQP